MKALIAGLFLLTVFGAPAHAQGKKIAGSKHDFSVAYVGISTVTGLAENYQYNYGACGVCHSAHKSKEPAQIWNRNAPTATGWIVYDAADPVNGKLLGVGDARFLAAADFVKTNSGRCLSCHDGQTVIGGNVKLAGTQGVAKNFGRDLHGKHPVGVKVPWGTHGWFTALNTAYPNAPAEAAEQVKTEAGDTVGCTSCHSMHNSENSSKILRGGDRCLACHDR